MNNQAITYTIILPHFNSNGLLRRALDSIPARNDIQIIVVDDKSTEPSIQKISKDTTYSYITFIFSKDKTSAGGARNRGLELAKGKYVLFTDSDDYFTPDAFEHFDYEIQQDNDLIQFKVSSFIEGSGKRGQRHHYLEKAYAKKGLSLYLSIEQPYAKLIKRKLINDHAIRFSDVPAGNDVYFSTQVALYAKNLKFIPRVVYQISQNNFSITTQQTIKNKCSRINEQIKKTQLIRKLTPFFFWAVYLSKGNIFKTTHEYINDPSSPVSLIDLSREYEKSMPKVAYFTYNCLRLKTVITDNIIRFVK